MSSCENYDPCFPDQPVVDLYLPIWANQPAFKSKPAFIWADDSPTSLTWASSITYAQLDSSVQSISITLLSSLHSCSGEALLILCPPGLQLVKIIFACQRAGLVAIPIIPPNLSEFSSSNQTPSYHHLLRALTQVNPKAAVAHHHYISTLTNLVSSKSTSDRLGQLQWLSIEDIDVIGIGSAASSTSIHAQNYSGCQPDEPYLVQYTSGATGIPKPVIVTAGAAAHNVRVARKAYDLQPSSVIVSWLPQYHDCGLMFLLLTVVSGATCVLTSPSAFLNRPRLWLELISEFRATCTPVPSFALPLVVRRGGINKGALPLNLASLRNLILINEPIYKSLVQEFVDEFMPTGLNPSSISPSYGLAENCTFVSTAWRWGPDSCLFPNLPSYKKLLPSARLTTDTEDIEIMVVNEETSEPVKDGVEGEVWISSASNASGYLGHPSLSFEVFNGRVRGKISNRCFIKTGDRGVIMRASEERYLYVMGRASDVIRVESRYQNSVHPHYLETAAYNSNPEHLRGGCIAALGLGVEMVGVIAELQKRRDMSGRYLNEYYKKICEGIREGVMREEGVSVGLVLLVESESVPKTTSGKLRRFMAKDMLQNGRFQVVYRVEFGFVNSLMSVGGHFNKQVNKDGSVEESVIGNNTEGETILSTSLRGAGPRLSLRSLL